MKKILKGSWLCLMALMISMSMVACGGSDDDEVMAGDSKHDSALVGTWNFFSEVNSLDPKYNRDYTDYQRTIVFNANGTGVDTRVERDYKSVDKFYWKTRKGVIGTLYEEDFESWDDEFEENNYEIKDKGKTLVVTDNHFGGGEIVVFTFKKK